MTTRAIVTILLWTLLVGCSDNGGATLPDAAIDASSDATRDAASDADVGVDGGDNALTWTSCGEGRVECATMVVPVDYDDPELGTMELALLRWPALSPSERIGVLLYGPGGPGGSGVGGARGLPGTMGSAMGEIVRRFDIVGMDVRGTGASKPRIHCTAEPAVRTFMTDIATADDDAEVEALIAGVFEACGKKLGAELLPHFDTVSTSKDIERLRTLLGEDQLSLIGSSYGTWFSAVYAVRYPHRVRAALLASAVTASNDVFDIQENQIRGTEKALEGFFDWCDANDSCAFRPTAGTTREAFDALAAKVVASPLASVSGAVLDRATFRYMLFEALKSPDYPKLAMGLAAAAGGNVDLILVAMTSFYDLHDWVEALIVISSLDATVAPGATVDDWRARLATIRAEAPSYGALASDRELMIRSKLAWPYPADEPFTIAAIPEAPPFLVLSADLDPATPIAGSKTLVEALGNGSVILDTQNIGHDSLRGPCALERGQQYLLDPTSLKDSPPMVACPEQKPDDTVVGTVSEIFVRDNNKSRRSETALGNLVADAMRAVAGTQIAMMNSGGMRTALPAASVRPTTTTLRRPDDGYAAGPPYDIVVDDLKAMHPWGNRMITLTVTGAQLHDLLEHAVGSYDGISGHSEFPQVSGIRLTFDDAAVPGSRIKTLALSDDTPIEADDSASYTLAVVDFIWYGGTGYPKFAETATSPPDLGGFFVDAVIDYLKSNSLTPGVDLSPSIEGRIEVL